METNPDWKKLAIKDICKTNDHIFMIGSSPFRYDLKMICDDSIYSSEMIWDNDNFICVLPNRRTTGILKWSSGDDHKEAYFDGTNISGLLGSLIGSISSSNVLPLLRSVGEYSRDWHTIARHLSVHLLEGVKATDASYDELLVINRLIETIPLIKDKDWQAAIDGFNDTKIWGWVKKAGIDYPQSIDVIVNEHIIKNNIIAGKFRKDLKDAGIGTGNFSFEIPVSLDENTPGPILVLLKDPLSQSIIDFRFFKHQYSSAHYRYKIEEWTPVLKGWIIAEDNPAKIVDIKIYLDGIFLGTVRNEIKRDDLLRNGIGTGRGGFLFETPASMLSPGEHELRIRFSGSSQEESYHFIGQGTTQRPLKDLSLLERRISIIIPYFEDPCLAECIERVLRYTPEHIRIIIVDDCSKDDITPGMLQKYSAHPLITILHNEVNLRFAGTVNVGIEAAGRDDVVILNQDVRVTPGWLKSLLLTAALWPNVATVTPMGDRAGAFSAPERGNFNPLPDGASEEEYARAFRRASFGLYPSVPTGHGYCMYISRKAIDEVGSFDANTFSDLYGEENDFCMRAVRAGWQHLIDDRAYVFHERTKSSEPGRAECMLEGSRKVKLRYPEYSVATSIFRDGWKLRHARFAGKIASKNWRKLIKPRILYVIGTLTGGTPQTNRDLMSSFRENAECYLLASDTQTISLYKQEEDELKLLLSHRLSDPIDPISHISSEYDSIVSGWLYQLDIDLVHFRSLIWHSLSVIPAAKRLGCKIVYSFHDFYALNPSLNLLDDAGVFMGDDYIERGSPYRADVWERVKFGPLPLHDADFRKFWRERFCRYLSFCDAYVTTSEEAQEIILRGMPQLGKDKFTVIRHGRNFSSMLNLRANYIPGETVRLLVLGNVGFHKGKGIIESLAEYDRINQEILEFHILGHSHGSSQGIKRYGTYEREQLPELVGKIRPHAAVIFSIWSETWCHTLTELWSMGIPVIVLDIGTVSRRVREAGIGWAISYTDIPDIYEKIVSICTNPAELRKSDEAIAAWRSGEGMCRTIEAMGIDYYRLYSSLLNEDKEYKKMPIIAVATRHGMGSSYLRTIDPCANNFLRNVAYLPVEGIQLRTVLHCGAVDGAIIQRDWLNKNLALECLALAKQKNIPICLELDDDLFVQKRPAAKHLEEMIRHANAITVTTEALAQKVKSLNDGVTIRESKLGFDRWPMQVPERVQDGYIRAMYYGTPSHVDDIRMILPAIKEIHTLFPFFRLALIRIGEDITDDIAGLEYIESYPVPREERPLPVFIKSVTKLVNKMDFAIAPLIDNEFNRGKSFIKVVEYGALGLTTIASNVGPYRKAGHIPHILLTDNTKEEWVKALKSRIWLSYRNRQQGAETWQFIRTRYMQNLDSNAEFDRHTLTWCNPGASNFPNAHTLRLNWESMP